MELCQVLFCFNLKYDTKKNHCRKTVGLPLFPKKRRVVKVGGKEASLCDFEILGRLT